MCSDVETMKLMIPDFDKTEDWFQLVMHEYFHSFQFSHKTIIDYLADTIKISSDSLNKIYLNYEWFRHSIENENTLLLKAIETHDLDSVSHFISEFIKLRKDRRSKFENENKSKIDIQEDFWEKIEGTARYVEYTMAKYFRELSDSAKFICDSLFMNFRDYKDVNYESLPQFVERTKIMQAYYYVTGFNMCRLLDKLKINYQENIFNSENQSLFRIIERRLRK
jgi:hypothetical protein